MDTLHSVTTQAPDSYMLFWTAVIAIATIVYVIVSISLLLINSKTLRLTKKLVESTNRPFLVPEQPTITLRPEPVSSFVNITVRNKGEVPSKGVIFTFKVTFDGQDIAISNPTFDPISIFPDVSVQIAVEIKNKGNQLLALEDEFPISTALLQFHFEIRYEGVYNQTYSTTFSYNYNPKLKDFVLTQSAWT